MSNSELISRIASALIKGELYERVSVYVNMLIGNKIKKGKLLEE